MSSPLLQAHWAYVGRGHEPTQPAVLEAKRMPVARVVLPPTHVAQPQEHGLPVPAWQPKAWPVQGGGEVQVGLGPAPAKAPPARVPPRQPAGPPPQEVQRHQ